MWSKWYLGMGTIDAGQWLLLGMLLFSSLLNIAYLLPVPVRAFFGTSRDGAGLRWDQRGTRQLPGRHDHHLACVPGPVFLP